MKHFLTLLILLISIQLFAQDYCPLNIGNKWVYYFQMNNVPMLTETLTRTIMSETFSADTTLYTLNQEIAGNIGDTTMTNYFIDIENDVLFAESITPINPDLITKFAQHTYTEDDFWVSPDGVDTLKIDFEGDVLLTEMTLSDCYKATSVAENGDSTAIYYAPDIGMIRTDVYLKEDEMSYSWILMDYELFPVNNSFNNANTDLAKSSLFSIKDNSYLQFNLKQNSKMSLNIFSLNGKKCYSDFITNTSTVNLNNLNLSNGMYLVEVRSGKLFDIKTVNIFK